MLQGGCSTGLGETHTEAGALVGLSRSQTSNIIVRRFGVSRAIVQRVLELSRPRKAPLDLGGSAAFGGLTRWKINEFVLNKAYLKNAGNDGSRRVRSKR